MHITTLDITSATVETIKGPGEPLFVVKLNVPKLGSFAYKALRSKDVAQSMAMACHNLDSHTVNTMLRSGQWIKLGLTPKN